MKKIVFITISVTTAILILNFQNKENERNLNKESNIKSQKTNKTTTFNKNRNHEIISQKENGTKTEEMEKIELVQYEEEIDTKTNELKEVVKMMTDSITQSNYNEDEFNTLEKRYSTLQKEITYKLRKYNLALNKEMNKINPYENDLDVKNWVEQKKGY